MKLFKCSCEDKPVLYFENVQCRSCGRVTGFSPEVMELKPFTQVEVDETETPQAGRAIWEDDAGEHFVQCANWRNHQVCNWMLPLTPDDSLADQVSFDSDPEGLCPACRLNDIIPDLSDPVNQPLWHGLEKAKRRCIFTLMELGMPIYGIGQGQGQGQDQVASSLPALSFRFMSDKQTNSNSLQPVEDEEPVFTGHADGVITINLAEADDIARTQARVAMQERYRTLLGHFRHETGHYYWDVFSTLDPEFVDTFREVFGDESASYQDALDRHYEQGPPVGWQDEFVSAYATMHPWEDWAETWAHYLHIIDTLETQQSFSRNSEILSDSVRDVSLPSAVGFRGDLGNSDFDLVMDLWIEVSVLLNSLNRSMGLPDPYPFVLHTPIQEKLRYVHDAIQSLSR